jgi:hypothetical protein
MVRTGNISATVTADISLNSIRTFNLQEYVDAYIDTTIDPINLIENMNAFAPLFTTNSALIADLSFCNYVSSPPPVLALVCPPGGYKTVSSIASNASIYFPAPVGTQMTFNIGGFVSKIVLSSLSVTVNGTTYVQGDTFPFGGNLYLIVTFGSLSTQYVGPVQYTAIPQRIYQTPQERTDNKHLCAPSKSYADRTRQLRNCIYFGPIQVISTLLESSGNMFTLSWIPVVNATSVVISLPVSIASISYGINTAYITLTNQQLNSLQSGDLIMNMQFTFSNVLNSTTKTVPITFRQLCTESDPSGLSFICTGDSYDSGYTNFKIFLMYSVQNATSITITTDNTDIYQYVIVDSTNAYLLLNMTPSNILAYNSTGIYIHVTFMASNCASSRTYSETIQIQGAL